MKKILIAGGVIIVALIVLIVVALSNLGPMIKTAVNKYGPNITQTEVKLSEVDVSLFSGEATLKNFLLGNPQGFNTPQAMTVKKVHVNVDEDSIFKDPVVIDKIEVLAPHINYELKGKTDNFRSLMNNIKETTGAQKAPAEKKEPAPAEGEKPKKNILIKEFVLKDGQVALAATLIKDQTVTAAMPDLRLTDIGKKEGGTTPAKAFQQIFDEIYAQIQSGQVQNALNKQLQELGASLDKIKGDARKQVDDTLEKGKKELDSTRESVQDSVNKGKKELDATKDSVKDQVKGLLGN